MSVNLSGRASTFLNERQLSKSVNLSKRASTSPNGHQFSGWTSTSTSPCQPCEKTRSALTRWRRSSFPVVNWRHFPEFKMATATTFNLSTKEGIQRPNWHCLLRESSPPLLEELRRPPTDISPTYLTSKTEIKAPTACCPCFKSQVCSQSGLNWVWGQR